MAYTPNIPAGTDNLSTSQGQIQANFNALNSLFGLDHWAWNDATNPGLHKKISLPIPLGADPTSPVSTASNLYTKAVSSVAQLFFQNATAVYQISPSIVTLGPPGRITVFGLTICWGTASITSGTNVNYTGSFTYSAAPTVVISGPVNGSNNVCVLQGAPTTAHFTVSQSNGGSSPMTIQWVAIGQT